MKKNTNLKTALTVTVTGCAFLICSSHFIWTESAATAVPGRPHQVSLFFGEVNFAQKEVSGGRLDEMDSVKAVCIEPGNKVVPLQLKKEHDRFSTAFIPAKSGLHQVLSSNEAAAVMDLRKSALGIVKPMYYSRQVVMCTDKGKSGASMDAGMQPYFILDLVSDVSNSDMNTFTVNRPLKFHTFFKKSPIKGGKIFAHAPNGWSKEIDADAQGSCTFTPLWEGRYVIDWVYTEQAPGTWRGVDYEAVRHRAVLTLHVAK